MSDEDVKLVADVYEAAITAERWPDVLHDLSQRVSAAGTALFLLRKDEPLRWTASEGMDALMRGWIEGGWQAKTQRAPRMIALRHPGFVSDLDIMTREELDRQPDQIGYLRPQGFGWGAGTFVEVPNGDVAVYSVERRFETGPFEAKSIAYLDGLRPHLARAALLANRLGLERARSAVAALETIGFAGAILDGRGRVVAANGLLERMSDQVQIAASNRLRFIAAGAQTALSHLFARADDVPRSGSLPLPATDASPPAVAHIVPVCGAAQDIFSAGASILVITPVAATSSPGIGILRSLFDLTPSEARVARAIADGQSVVEISEQSSLSTHTVRSQLKGAMAKLQVSRQADIVRLLAGLTLNRRP